MVAAGVADCPGGVGGPCFTGEVGGRFPDGGGGWFEGVELSLVMSEGKVTDGLWEPGGAVYLD